MREANLTPPRPCTQLRLDEAGNFEIWPGFQKRPPNKQRKAAGTSLLPAEGAGMARCDRPGRHRGARPARQQPPGRRRRRTKSGGAGRLSGRPAVPGLMVAARRRLPLTAGAGRVWAGRPGRPAGARRPPRRTWCLSA